MSKMDQDIAKVAGVVVVIWGAVEAVTEPFEVMSLSIEGPNVATFVGFALLGLSMLAALLGGVSSGAKSLAAQLGLGALACLVLGFGYDALQSRWGKREAAIVQTESPQVRVEPPRAVIWDHSECARSIEVLRQMHANRWAAYVSRDQEKHCRRELADAGFVGSGRARETESAIRDETYCLNRMSELKTRYGDDWRRGVSRELWQQCSAVIGSSSEDRRVSPSAGGPEPGFVGYGQVPPLSMSEPQRQQYCLRMIDIAKRQFGYSWLSHVHQQRKIDCHDEIVDVIGSDRDTCRYTTGCDLSVMPKIEDLYR